MRHDRICVAGKEELREVASRYNTTISPTARACNSTPPEHDTSNTPRPPRKSTNTTRWNRVHRLRRTARFHGRPALVSWLVLQQALHPTRHTPRPCMFHTTSHVSHYKARLSTLQEHPDNKEVITMDRSYLLVYASGRGIERECARESTCRVSYAFVWAKTTVLDLCISACYWCPLPPAFACFCRFDLRNEFEKDQESTNDKRSKTRHESPPDAGYSSSSTATWMGRAEAYGKAWFLSCNLASPNRQSCAQSYGRRWGYVRLVFIGR